MNRESLSYILPALGKLLYSYPEKDFLTTIKNADILGQIPYETENPAFRTGQMLLAKWQNTVDDFDAAVSDYQDLFVGVRSKVKVPAWESIYVSSEPIMFGDCTLKARLWYDRYGMEIKNIRHEPDDHMGIELIFLGYLMKEDISGADNFFKEHIANWYHKFFAAMVTNAATDLYRGLAMALLAICEDVEATILTKV